VFCQKPLSRTAAETCQVLRAARCADRLLDVDLSYRHLSATTAVRQVLRNGDIGDIYAAQLVFHNAYGPDKPWFYDPVLSGGGCVLDLGVHLVDLVLWLLDFPEVTDVRSRLFAEGRRVRTPGRHVEDFATAWIELDGRIDVSLACSWNLPAGREAVIEMTMFGTRGGVSIRNVNGSFYDFVAERFIGTRSHRLHEPPDDWGGRAIAGWAERLAVSAAYDRSIEHAATVATVIDRIYGRDI
jgi:predicted dehydrogenase